MRRRQGLAQPPGLHRATDLRSAGAGSVHNCGPRKWYMGPCDRDGGPLSIFMEIELFQDVQMDLERSYKAV